MINKLKSMWLSTKQKASELLQIFKRNKTEKAAMIAIADCTITTAVYGTATIIAALNGYWAVAIPAALYTVYEICIPFYVAVRAFILSREQHNFVIAC